MTFRASMFLVILALVCEPHLSIAAEKPAMKASPPIETEAMRALMVGSWYGERATSNGEFIRILTKRKSDGTFTAQFLVTEKDGRVVNDKEAGIWGVRKPVYFTATRGFIFNGKFEQGDVRSADLYDAYEILALSKDSFTYYSLTSGNTFVAKRVSDDFELK